MFQRLFVLSVLVLMGACSSQEPVKATPFNVSFNQLQLDMTIDQVQKLLGPPDLREVKPAAPSARVNLETWHYNNQDGGPPGTMAGSAARQVVFDGGHVVSFGRDVVAAPAAGPNDSSVDPASRAIGEECKYDRDCKEHNCHFHICSGKNNCQVQLGGVCAINMDCCVGRCDFGHCRN